MQELMKDKLYSFDEKVRVEIGPQIVELDCTNANLSDKITHSNYKVGKIDAIGNAITAEKVGIEGTKMNCVDWKEIHAPHMWKVYQMQECGVDKKTKKPILRFIKVNEFESKEDALSFAKELFEEGVK